MLTRKDIKALLKALLLKQGGSPMITAENLNGFFCRELGGGYSGSLVALLWLDELPTLILKAGPAAEILAETEARSHFASPALDSIRALGLSDCSEPVEVEVNGRDELWRAMAYTYVGGLTYEDLNNFSDFQAIFEDFLAPPRDESKPSSQALRSWLDRMCEQIKQREPPLGPANRQTGIRAKPLSEFLPSVPWDAGLTAVLQSVAAYAPESADFLSFRDWWEQALDKESMAAFPSKTLLHGDLRFANVLVNRTTAEVELIDFGNSAEGHVFRDLARFECDLLFRITVPRTQTTMPHQSSDDRRIRSLEYAFNPATRQLRDPQDPDNPLLAALEILREVYDKYWNLGSNQGRRRMYQWFLLAEVLKRLMWTEDIFSTVEGRRALLVGASLLRKGIDGRLVEARAFGSVSDLPRLLHCTALYVPIRGHEATVNRQRNADKIRALQQAAASGSKVKLLAETGNSYLHFRGPFYPEVEALVRTGSLQVVLVNPDFSESNGISVAYNDPSSVDTFGVHPLLRQKFDESLAGYAALRSQSKDNVEVRIARYGITTTLLITEDEIFFEPYFRSDRRRRHQRMFETFELRFSAVDGHVHDLLDEHFKFYWSNSDSVAEFIAVRERYKLLMQELRSVWGQADD
jgi:Phosphotransferase enzyme family